MILEMSDSYGRIFYSVIDMVFNCFKTFLCDLKIPYLEDSLVGIFLLVLVTFVLFKLLVWGLKEGL